MRVLSFATPLALALMALSVSAAAQCPTGKVKGPSSFSGDKFGRALSRSGDELVVGAWLTVSVFTLDDTGTPLNALDDTWTLQSTLVSPDPEFSDEFGAAVGVDGDHLVIGAPTAGGIFGFGPGAAHIYRRDENGPTPLDDSWVEQASLNLGSSTIPKGFGGSVGLSGDYVAIGALQDHLATQGSSFGTVHVYRRDNSGTPHDLTDDLWPEQAVVVSDDTSYGRFGEVVWLEGKRLIVSAPYQAGAVYTFWRDDKGTAGDPTDDEWIEQAKVVPPVGETVIKFGRSLDFDGSLMAVGASGKAFLFRLNENNTPLELSDDFWMDEATLVGSETPTLAYGSAVAVSGDLALVGDPSKMVDGTQIGVTHVFRSDVVQGTGDFGWTEVVKLASPAPPASKFGAALRMDGIRVFVGEIGTFAALTADEAQDFQAGAVWPFVMATQPWAFQDAALAGTGGEPCLMGSGLLEADSPTVVAMHHELVNTPTAFVIGFSAINAPFKGGVLVPQPTSVLWSATDPMGNISLNARWPNGVASGTNLYLQAWTIDLQVPGGFSATNGMHGVTP